MNSLPEQKNYFSKRVLELMLRKCYIENLEKEYIVNTNYFNQRWTWILRGVRFLIAMLFLYLVDLQELENGSNILVLGFIFAALLAIVLLVWPTDELALDKDNIYFIRKSL